MISSNYTALGSRENATNLTAYYASEKGQQAKVSSKNAEGNSENTYTGNGVVLTLSDEAKMASKDMGVVRAYATASSTTSVLKVGSRGTAVETLQKNLTKLGYDTKGTDGIFGNDTKSAVVSFQRAYGLSPDGIVGSSTQNAIAKALNYHNNGILTVGSRGTAVETLQKNLTKLGYDTNGTDGIFGNDTKNAVISFQRAYNLDDDGIVGASTQNAISKALANLANKPAQPVNPPSGQVPQFQGHEDLGYLSAKFEASGECGTISTGTGDSGGKSYGLYQFASKVGTPKAFVNWLKNEDTTIYNELNDAYTKDGGCGSNFDNAWKKMANLYEDRFSELQYNFTKKQYYDVSVEKIKKNLGFDVTQRGYTLNAVIWSRGVQMGGCGTIFTRAVQGLDLATASDEDIIRAIYKENSKVTSTPPYSTSNVIKAADGDKYGITGKYLYYFSKNASNVQAGVYNRLTNTELNEALKLLEQYG